MNKTLITGIVIISSLIVVALLAPWIAPYDLTDQTKIEYIIGEDGTGKVLVPPVPPSSMHPLGTDKHGYDLLTKLLYGAKYTVFLSMGIAVLRVLLGGLAGLLLGYYSRNSGKKNAGASYWSVLNGIPVFLVVWLTMLGVSINAPASTFAMSCMLAVILLAIGIPSVASVVKAKVIVLREKQFVTAAHSLGAGDLAIMFRHLLPHLKESLLILAVQEVVLILTLFGQLAIFNVFVGGTIMYTDPLEFHSRSHEWGGLIGASRGHFYVHQWIFYMPLTLYMTLITGFYLISKGLEKKYGKQYAKHSYL